LGECLLDVDSISYDNLILWVAKLTQIESLTFIIDTNMAHLCEHFIDKVSSYSSLIGLPLSLRHFRLTSKTYLGSFKCLEPLVLFVLRQRRTFLKTLEIDLNLGIAVENTEKLMQAF